MLRSGWSAGPTNAPCLLVPPARRENGPAALRRCTCTRYCPAPDDDRRQDQDQDQAGREGGGPAAGAGPLASSGVAPPGAPPRPAFFSSSTSTSTSIYFSFCCCLRDNIGNYGSSYLPAARNAGGRCYYYYCLRQSFCTHTRN